MTEALGPWLILGVLAVFIWRGHVLLDRRQQAARPRTFNGKPLRQILEELARPGYVLAPSVAPTFSRFGGDPELPAGLPWPNAEERPMRFLARVALSEVSAPGGVDWLPGVGALYVFCDIEYLDQHAVRIVHAPDVETTIVDADQNQRPSRGLALRPIRCAPSLDWLGLKDGFAEGFEPDPEFSRIGPRHMLGGYPEELQEEQMAVSCERLSRGEEPPSALMVSPAEIERASAIWRQLFQFDDDPSLGLQLAGGRLFVFVREGDARAGDFSRTVTIWQPG